ncbi:MAG TPA: hypothetical protein VN370_08875 [Desulfitobacteriaceae bacterium]|nr:hypothetical protein [Desulfitobacteriaceae bacterium]
MYFEKNKQSNLCICRLVSLANSMVKFFRSISSGLYTGAGISNPVFGSSSCAAIATRQVKRYFDFRTLPVGKTKSPVARCKNQRTAGLL